MTADEWNNLHPDHAQALIDTWSEKHKREEIRHAVLQFTIAQWSGNVRKGVKLKLDDFLPKQYRETKQKITTPEEIEKMFSDFIDKK